MDNKIDFVITWVDGNDKVWLSKKKDYESNVNKKSESNSKIRYRDWGLLKYWFRGVEKFTPWVNKIFLITDNQIPKWLDTSNEKLIIVNHEDFIPKEYLPTFNSNVIEMYMNRINCLSEKFVYFNDDMFITNYLNEEYFFKNNLPKDALVFNAVSVSDKNTIIEHTILNNLEIVAKEYKKNDVLKSNFNKIFNIKYGKDLYRNFALLLWKNYTGIYNHHMPISYLKSSFDFIWENNKELLEKNSMNKFRTKNDYSHWIFRYYQLLSGSFIPKSFRKDYYHSLMDDNEKFLNNLKNKKYKMICINDSNENINFDRVKYELQNAFECILNKKSKFEI